MITGAGNNELNSDDRLSLYDGLSKSVDVSLKAHAGASAEAQFDVVNELALLRERVQSILEQLGIVQTSTELTPAKKFEAEMLYREMLADATGAVVDAALKAVRIRQLGKVWDEQRVRAFMSRLLSLLSLELIHEPERLSRITKQCEGIFDHFADAQGTTYTPDQDVHDMDATVPRC